MMARRAAPLFASLGFLGFLLVRLSLCMDRLPERMATHFDFAGRANGFESKTTFVWTSLVLSLLMFVLFAALPALMARLPTKLVNLPHKDYWLAPARRAETLARLCPMFDWLGAATLGLLVGVFELTIRANLNRSTLGFQIWILLAAYHLFVLLWIVSYLRIFRRPSGA